MTTITYLGTRGKDNNPQVYKVKGESKEALNPRLSLRNHSPTGFEWGYGGSGPAQLALAILCDIYGSKFALHWYQDFKWAVISQLSRSHDWELTQGRVREAMDAIQARHDTPPRSA